MQILAPSQYWYLAYTPVRPAREQNTHKLYELPLGTTKEQCRDAVQRLIKHFPSLRMGFARVDDVWTASVIPPGEVEIFSAIHCDDQLRLAEVASAEAQSLHASLHESRPPLARFCFIDMPSGHRPCLLLSINHLVFDAITLGIIRSELENLLQGRRALTKPCQFPAWLEDIRAFIASDLERSSAFWLREPWDASARIPIARRPALLKDRKWAFIQRRTPPATLAAIRALALRQGVETSDVLTAIAAETVFRLAGGDFVGICLWDQGRPSIRFLQSVGVFAYFWPIGVRRDIDGIAGMSRQSSRIRRNGEQKFAYLLARHGNVTEAARRAFRAIPEPQIRMNYLGEGRKGPGPTGVRQPTKVNVTFSTDSSTSHELFLELEFENGALLATWEYSAALYEEDALQVIADAFTEIVSELPGVLPSS